MQTRQDAISTCMKLSNVYEDYPFHDPNWTAMRHKSNDKIFALIFEKDNQIWINVKAKPEWGAFWRQTYDAVVPAFHMNKQHWISIILDGTMTEEQIFPLIAESHAITEQKRKQSLQNKLP